MEFIKTKTILSKSKYPEYWFGTLYNMNLYRGCNHGCIYCDSRSECYKIEEFDKVKGKENEIEILNKELASKRQKGAIGIGAMSDTYNPLEKTYEITRKALELINQYGFGVGMATKSDLILRDIDLLKKINENNDVIIQITITCADDELAKKIEPYASSSSERFGIIKELTDNGIFTGILLMPILPFINDTEDNIINIVKKARDSGAKFIYASMGMTLREGQRDYYYKRIDELFPGLSNKYKQTYGNKYSCHSMNSKKLYNVFKTECEKYNILYKMEDIIKAYQKDQNEQLTLF